MNVIGVQSLNIIGLITISIIIFDLLEKINFAHSYSFLNYHKYHLSIFTLLLLIPPILYLIFSEKNFDLWIEEIFLLEINFSIIIVIYYYAYFLKKLIFNK